MSYILDALKKSEKERRRGEQPDVFAPQFEPPSLSLFRIRWKLIGWSFAGGLVLLTIFYLIATRLPEKETPTQTTTTTAAQTPPAMRQQPSPPQPNLADNRQEPAAPTQSHSSLSFSAEKHRKQQPAQDAKTERVNIVVKPIDIQPGSMLVSSYDKLPATLRDALPELKFAGHAYAQTPLARLIIINNKILREGDRLNPDLQLLEITPKGVILNFRGKRFSMDLE